MGLKILFFGDEWATNNLRLKDEENLMKDIDNLRDEIGKFVDERIEERKIKNTSEKKCEN